MTCRSSSSWRSMRDRRTTSSGSKTACDDKKTPRWGAAEPRPHTRRSLLEGEAEAQLHRARAAVEGELVQERRRRHEDVAGVKRIRIVVRVDRAVVRRQRSEE